jgi:hypothetical protein
MILTSEQKDELERLRQPDARELRGCRKRDRRVAGVERAAEARPGMPLRGHERMFSRTPSPDCIYCCFRANPNPTEHTRSRLRCPLASRRLGRSRVSGRERRLRHHPHHGRSLCRQPIRKRSTAGTIAVRGIGARGSNPVVMTSAAVPTYLLARAPLLNWGVGQGRTLRRVLLAQAFARKTAASGLSPPQNGRPPNPESVRYGRRRKTAADFPPPSSLSVSVPRALA